MQPPDRVGAQPAQQHRIPLENGQVRDPPTTSEQETDQTERESVGAVVAFDTKTVKRASQASDEIDRLEVAPKKLETGMGRDAFLRKSDRKIALDARSNFGLLLSLTIVAPRMRGEVW